ncbi:MAG: maltose alpha-D-glucosyltransferase [Pirellulaceae bacterium]
MPNNPLWYKDAIIYELHVRAFHDSIGDGRGDFRGLMQKLDYLQDLGVNALWLLPFYPSPLRDDGYDIADYTSVHPDFGNLDSFREFLDAAHARGLRVITELVLNHTSDQHAWFQRARRAPPGSSERDFYVWSDSPERYSQARVIFKDFESSNWSYDNVARAYYWHRFYSHQPDLNYDNPAVRKAMLPIVDFWFEMGVDGLRLDAVPYLFEREGTNCENLSETHTFLKTLRQHVDARFPDRMLLAEANQWPEDAAAYFGNGDECQMAFHFPLMPRLFMAMHTEDRFPIVDIVEQTPNIPDNCQWAIFLRNHDELTLEMVTDEERDYMYRAYAGDRRARINLGIRRRLAPLLGNNRRRIELMNGLLFSLPGTPVLYYGDEIGMGDNIYLGDRNGVRTPMQWSSDRNAGFSRANPQRLYLPIIIDPEYHYEAINVEAQQENPNSLLWWNKRLISLRQQHRPFSRGGIRFLDPHNRRILAFLRNYEEEQVLVVASLSRFVQFVELDLSAFEGATPIELFGSTPFPKIGKLPYLLTLGPYVFYWFSLCSRSSPAECGLDVTPSQVALHLSHLVDWEQLFDATQAHTLREVLLRYAATYEAAGDEPRHVRQVHLRDNFRFQRGEAVIRLLLVDVEFNVGQPETFVLRLAFVPSDVAAQWPAGSQPPILARISGPKPGVIYSAAADPTLLRAAFEAYARQFKARGERGGELTAWLLPRFAEDMASQPIDLSMVTSRTEQSNLSTSFGDRWMLKMFRRIEEGVHPEVEMGQLLTERGMTKLVPALVGAIEYRRRRSDPMTLSVLHAFVPSQSDAWQYTLDAVSDFFERMAATTLLPPPLRAERQFEPDNSTPSEALEFIGEYLGHAALLGTRLAELHTFFSLQQEVPDFVPEPFTLADQRSLYQSMRGVSLDLLNLLQDQLAGLSEDQQTSVRHLLASEAPLLALLKPLLDSPLQGQRIRIHADCHLGQILYTGKDFLFIDFEGVPTQSLGERRLKRSPLRDVAGMVCSLEDAVQSTLLGLGTGRGHPQGVIRSADRAALSAWAEFWRHTVTRAFLAAYLNAPGIRPLLPLKLADSERLLRIFTLERWASEFKHELHRRPRWLAIPINSLLRLIAP